MTHVVVQLGHCNRTVGSTGTNGEQDYVKLVGNEAARRLTALGHRADLRLADDPAIRSDVFVALHADGSNHETARGASVGHRGDAPSVAAADMFKRTYQRMGFPGGFRPDNYTNALADYYGVREAKQKGTPVAFIVEGGFLTNQHDSAWMTSATGIAGCAQAVVAAALGREPNLPKPQEEDMAVLVQQAGHPEVWHMANARTLVHIVDATVAEVLTGDANWRDKVRQLPANHRLFTDQRITRVGP